MSLFDRLKSVFTGNKPDGEEKRVSAEEESNQSLRQLSQTKDADKQDELEEFAESSADAPIQSSGERTEADRYDQGLEKSRKSLSQRFNELMARFRYIDEEFFDDLEDVLIESDVGFEATLEISDVLREEAAIQNISNLDQAENLIVETLINLYEKNVPDDSGINLQTDSLTVILFVGVNGVGKTTTIAKLAHQYISQGKKVMLAAGDTFRAGAIEQLHVWGDRVGAQVISSEIGGDPAAVVYDAVKQAQDQDADILMVDTAGRLQNKKNLMKELEKMHRIIQREIPDAPHETLLVLDGTTGQNALNQAKQFQETTDVTGIVLTKMDGTARGGIVMAIGKELGIPVKFVGFGESMDDLREFDADQYAYGLFKDLVEDAV